MKAIYYPFRLDKEIPPGLLRTPGSPFEKTQTKVLAPQTQRAIDELAFRAAASEADAAEWLYELAATATSHLVNLAKRTPEVLRPIARTWPVFPVLSSPKEERTERTKRLLASLGVSASLGQRFSPNGIPSGNERATQAPPSKPGVPPVEGWDAHEDPWSFKLASRRNREQRLGSHRVYKRAMSTENHLLIAAMGFALPAFGQGLAAAGVSPSHFFNLEFRQMLVTSTVGVALGAGVTYWIARYVEGRKVQAERSKLVLALRAALEKNLLIVVQLSEHLSSPAQWRDPVDSADLTILDATSVWKYELLRDIAQAAAIDKARFQLVQLNGLLSSLRNTTALVAGQGVTFESHYKIIRDKTKSQLAEIKTALEAALRSLSP